jgi:hypothetical protein
MVLADVTRHLADAVSSLTGREKEAALQAIRLHFEEELDSPTSQTHGSFQG